MDPLSICVSAVTLIGVSTKVTKGLHSFARYAIHAEDYVASLCTEITTLEGYLSSIHKTLKSCRRNTRALDVVDAELWRRSDLAIQHCKATLNELSTFVETLQTPNKTRFWRAKVAVELSIHHARKLEEFRAKVKEFNYGLQSVLQTINVSVSLQNNASQDRILLELDRLKSFVKEAVCIGTQPSLTALPETTMATNNLQSLIKAVESFHSSAITSVGSSLGGSVADWPPQTTTSIAGLAPYREKILHDFLEGTMQASNLPAATITEARDLHPVEFPYFIAEESAEPTESPSMPTKSTPDVDFKLPLVEVLEEFATEKMKTRDFENAARILNQALSGEMGPVSETETQMRLQTRLGICYVLQRKIPEARKVISKLEKNGGLENREVLHLMHALAMVHFARYEFTEANYLGTRILHAKTRLLGKSHPETLTSLGFLCHLYDQFNSPVYWEASRRLLPQDYVYSHPESEFDFLAQHAMLMPAIASESGQFELACTSLSEDSQSASAQTAETGCQPNHNLKRALTRYDSQHADETKIFLSITVVHPDEETDCPAPEIMASRNGPKRMMSRSMTTMRRHLSTWRSSKPATEGNEQASTENANPRRSRTVLRKTVPQNRMEPPGHTELARAKSFLGKLKTEIPVITTPTQDILAVHELDSKRITREGPAKQPKATDEAQETVADHGVLASTPVVPPSELLRVRVPPLDMSLNVIPEVSELHSGEGCDLENGVTIIVEDLSEGSMSGESSNHSIASGSSYSTNTTVSEAASASSVDCSDGDNSPVLRSASQRPEMVQLAKSSFVSSLNASRTFNSCHNGGPRRSASLLAATNSTHKPYGRWGRTHSLPKAMDIRHGLSNNGYRSYSPDRNAQGLLNVPLGACRDGSAETHDLKRTFSWIRGDEQLSILKLPNREPQTNNAQTDDLQGEDGDHNDDGQHV